MALDPVELRRGRIVWAVFPFAPEFPAETLEEAERVRFEDAEAYARARKGAPTEFITEARLRPVLLLHDGSRDDHGDILCLRINSVKAKHREGTQTWRRITDREHPFFFHLPAGGYGLDQESLISLTSVGSIHKSVIAAIKPPGDLSSEEMRVISERLTRVLSMDLAPLIAKRARELLERAGIVR